MLNFIVHHVSDSDPAEFHVSWWGGHQSGIVVPSPQGFPVKGRPKSGLSVELRWYLEEFLKYPFEPETTHAERVVEALYTWGATAFSTLFRSTNIQETLGNIAPDTSKRISIQIVSGDPVVLSWPWEVLGVAKYNKAALPCRIERRLVGLPQSSTTSIKLLEDCINVLLVTARPYRDDVRYCLIAQALLKAMKNCGIPVSIHVLRPPTIEHLQAHLTERPNFYHVFHFDGHGLYDASMGSTEGCIIFEDERCRGRRIDGRELGDILKQSGIPLAILNACQSAMLDKHAKDPFAAVGTSLMMAGIQSVIAMSYSLWASGAEVFFRAFYEHLFENGNLSDATSAGRIGMYNNRSRLCRRGWFDLEDWLIPVLYCQENTPNFTFLRKSQFVINEEKSTGLPPEISEEFKAFGFIDRDREILELERAMRQGPTVLIIHGLGGIGKTTFTAGFISWLHKTDGFGQGCFWFCLDQVRSVQHIIDSIGKALFGDGFSAERVDTKIPKISALLRIEPYIIVCDGFEVVKGSERGSIVTAFPQKDRQDLLRFVKELQNGATKVLITSRSREEWINLERQTVSIGGLDTMGRLEFCERLHCKKGIKINWDDTSFIRLMDYLSGHPLVMRVILPKLEFLTADEIMVALQNNLTKLGLSGDSLDNKLQSTLRFATDHLPEDLTRFLTPLALHERFFDRAALVDMAEKAGVGSPAESVGKFLGAMEVAGLITKAGQSLYAIHPTLTGFLRIFTFTGQPSPDRERWCKAFVKVMAKIAGQIAPRKFADQQLLIKIYFSNLHNALLEASRQDMHAEEAALCECLGHHALDTRDLAEAQSLFEHLARAAERTADKRGEATAYHQLGIVADEDWNLTAALAWYRKSLSISEPMRYADIAGATYLELGRTMQKQRAFTSATRWYKKSLRISEQLRDSEGIAHVYHLLGRVAEEQHLLTDAEKWYRKSLAIYERRGEDSGAAVNYDVLAGITAAKGDLVTAQELYERALGVKLRIGNVQGASATYHMLGVLSHKRKDFKSAEKWYKKSLEAKGAQLSHQEGVARTYHQLGRLAQDIGDLSLAEKWFMKSLEIDERLHNLHSAAGTQHQLGRISQDRKRFTEAQGWYRKSLTIAEKLKDEYGAYKTYHQLGRIAHLQGDLTSAEKWYKKSIEISTKLNDNRAAAIEYDQLAQLASDRSDYIAAERLYKQLLPILQKFGDEKAIARTYGQLGILSYAKGQLVEAGQLYMKHILASLQLDDLEEAQKGISVFRISYDDASLGDKAKLKAMWEKAGLSKFASL